MDPISLALIGMTGFKAIAGWFGGRSAARTAEINARTTIDIANANADLIDEGAELNAGMDDFNADALHGQSLDATFRGRETEGRFRVQIRGLIGAQRAGYAGQGVDVSDGSALEIQKDTAYQGELDAITIRANAAREAWGFDLASQGERMQGAATRKLGKLQSDNTRATGRANAAALRAGGSNARAEANWGVAGTILTGGYNLAVANRGG